MLKPPQCKHEDCKDYPNCTRWEDDPVEISKTADYQVTCTDCIYTRYYPYTLACHAAQKHANSKNHRVHLLDVSGDIVETFTKLTPEIIPDQPPF